MLITGALGKLVQAGERKMSSVYVYMSMGAADETQSAFRTERHRLSTAGLF